MARPLRIEYEGGGSLSYYFESECKGLPGKIHYVDRGSLSYYFESECKRVYKMQIALCFFKDVIYIEAIQ